MISCEMTSSIIRPCLGTQIMVMSFNYYFTTAITVGNATDSLLQLSFMIEIWFWVSDRYICDSKSWMVSLLQTEGNSRLTQWEYVPFIRQNVVRTSNKILLLFRLAFDIQVRWFYILGEHKGCSTLGIRAFLDASNMWVVGCFKKSTQASDDVAS